MYSTLHTKATILALLLLERTIQDPYLLTPVTAICRPMSKGTRQSEGMFSATKRQPALQFSVSNIPELTF
jgi:hypothetical protein